MALTQSRRSISFNRAQHERAAAQAAKERIPLAKFAERALENEIARCQSKAEHGLERQADYRERRRIAVPKSRSDLADDAGGHLDDPCVEYDDSGRP